MPTEVEAIIARARARGACREACSPKPDYAAANQVLSRQEAALTRAINSRQPDRVVLACRDAVNAWSHPPFDGLWPDDWSRWQRALDDALRLRSVLLEDLLDPSPRDEQLQLSFS